MPQIRHGGKEIMRTDASGNDLAGLEPTGCLPVLSPLNAEGSDRVSALNFRA
jgi:hypothetical protein